MTYDEKQQQLARDTKPDARFLNVIVSDALMLTGGKKLEDLPDYYYRVLGYFKTQQQAHLTRQAVRLGVLEAFSDVMSAPKKPPQDKSPRKRSRR